MRRRIGLRSVTFADVSDTANPPRLYRANNIVLIANSPTDSVYLQGSLKELRNGSSSHRIFTLNETRTADFVPSFKNPIEYSFVNVYTKSAKQKPGTLTSNLLCVTSSSFCMKDLWDKVGENFKKIKKGERKQYVFCFFPFSVILCFLCSQHKE